MARPGGGRWPCGLRGAAGPVSPSGAAVGSALVGQDGTRAPPSGRNQAPLSISGSAARSSSRAGFRGLRIGSSAGRFATCRRGLHGVLSVCSVGHAMNLRIFLSPLRLLLANLVVLGLMVAPAPAQAGPAFGTTLLNGGDWLGGRGVSVYSNGTSEFCCGGGSTVGSTYVGIKWQCVELAQRLHTVRGWHAGELRRGTAKEIYGAAARNGLKAYPNGGGYLPVPGDLIIEGATVGNAAGHVAVVDSVAGGTVRVVEQNFGQQTGRGIYTLAGSTLSRGGRPITGTVHAPANSTVPPTEPSGSTATSSDQVVQRTSSATDVYAVNNASQLAQITLTPTGWSPWAILGTGFISEPTAILRPNGLEDVFAVNNASQLAHITLTTTGWSSWEVLGSGFATSSVATVRPNGLEDVFAVNNGSQIAHRTLTPTGWSSWEVRLWF